MMPVFRFPCRFINQVTIWDVQLRRQWHFMLNNWLSPLFGGGKTTRSLEPWNEKQPLKYTLRTLSEQQIREEHLWLSIITRPATSSFTRVQRVTCALGFLFAAMLTNMMFFGRTDDPNEQVEMGLGAFTFSFTEFIVSIQSLCIAVPLNALAVFLFKKSSTPIIQIKPEKIGFHPKRSPSDGGGDGLSEVIYGSAQKVASHDESNSSIKNADLGPVLSAPDADFHYRRRRRRTAYFSAHSGINIQAFAKSQQQSYNQESTSSRDIPPNVLLERRGTGYWSAYGGTDSQEESIPSASDSTSKSEHRSGRKWDRRRTNYWSLHDGLDSKFRAPPESYGNESMSRKLPETASLLSALESSEESDQADAVPGSFSRMTRRRQTAYHSLEDLHISLTIPQEDSLLETSSTEYASSEQSPNGPDEWSDIVSNEEPKSSHSSRRNSPETADPNITNTPHSHQSKEMAETACK